MATFLNSKNLKSNTNFPFLVMDANVENSIPKPPGFHILHWHEDFQFILCISGTVKIRTLSNEVILLKNDGIFINKNVVHQVLAQNNGHYYSFVFPEQLISFYSGSPTIQYINSISTCEQLPFYYFSRNINWCSKCLDYLHELASIEKNKPVYYEYEILTLISRLWLEMLKNIELPEYKNKSTTEKRMEIFLFYITLHYSQAISLDDLAKSAHVSKSECLRCFKQTLQTTPYKYLTEFRLKQSIELLTTTSLSIGEISSKVGFNQFSHFGKCFKEKTGVSPSQYRKDFLYQKE